ncbi:MAG: hypothetical protein GC138_10315 [Gammaproteobacteria bacterium]|nr:hypothetical protein [Gammaproteobacteria bacterium]
MDQSKEPRLLDRVRERCRVKHFSIRTEKSYVDWIRRFILFHNKRHPAEMGASEVEAYLTHLAVVGQVSASTQNQALVFVQGSIVYRVALAGWDYEGQEAAASAGRSVQNGSSRSARPIGWDPPSDRIPVVRFRIAFDGGDAVARQGRRFRAA